MGYWVARYRYPEIPCKVFREIDPDCPENRPFCDGRSCKKELNQANANARITCETAADCPEYRPFCHHPGSFAVSVRRMKIVHLAGMAQTKQACVCSVITAVHPTTDDNFCKQCCNIV